jgi:hypothetical protein
VLTTCLLGCVGEPLDRTGTPTAVGARLMQLSSEGRA